MKVSWAIGAADTKLNDVTVDDGEIIELSCNGQRQNINKELKISALALALAYVLLY